MFGCLGAELNFWWIIDGERQLSFGQHKAKKEHETRNLGMIWATVYYNSMAKFGISPFKKGEWLCNEKVPDKKVILKLQSTRMPIILLNLSVLVACHGSEGKGLILSGDRTKCVSSKHRPQLERARIHPLCSQRLTGRGLVHRCRPQTDYEIWLAIDHGWLRPWTVDKPQALQYHWSSGLSIDCHSLIFLWKYMIFERYCSYRNIYLLLVVFCPFGESKSFTGWQDDTHHNAHAKIFRRYNVSHQIWKVIGNFSTH